MLEVAFIKYILHALMLFASILCVILAVLSSFLSVQFLLFSPILCLLIKVTSLRINRSTTVLNLNQFLNPTTSLVGIQMPIAKF